MSRVSFSRKTRFWSQFVPQKSANPPKTGILTTVSCKWGEPNALIQLSILADFRRKWLGNGSQWCWFVWTEPVFPKTRFWSPCCSQTVGFEHPKAMSENGRKQRTWRICGPEPILRSWRTMSWLYRFCGPERVVCRVCVCVWGGGGVPRSFKTFFVASSPEGLVFVFFSISLRPMTRWANCDFLLVSVHFQSVTVCPCTSFSKVCRLLGWERTSKTCFSRKTGSRSVFLTFRSASWTRYRVWWIRTPLADHECKYQPILLRS